MHASRKQDSGNRRKDAAGERAESVYPQVREVARAMETTSVFSSESTSAALAAVGDARDLDLPSGSADAVLLLVPLRDDDRQRFLVR